MPEKSRRSPRREGVIWLASERSSFLAERRPAQSTFGRGHNYPDTGGPPMVSGRD